MPRELRKRGCARGQRTKDQEWRTRAGPWGFESACEPEMIALPETAVGAALQAWALFDFAD